MSRMSPLLVAFAFGQFANLAQDKTITIEPELPYVVVSHADALEFDTYLKRFYMYRAGLLVLDLRLDDIQQARIRKNHAGDRHTLELTIDGEKLDDATVGLLLFV